MRTTVRATVVILVGALAASSIGCSGQRRAPQPAPTIAAPTTAVPTAAGCPVPTVGPLDPGSVLVPGPTGGLPVSDAGGEKMTIVATVLDGACAPAAGASVRAWHTDARGDYGPRGTNACCYFGGTVTTDANGRFRLDTIRPAQYPQPNAPPAHVHFEIRHASGRLDTEIVFTESGAAAGPARPANRVPVALTRRTDGWYGEVTFVLAP